MSGTIDDFLNVLEGRKARDSHGNEYTIQGLHRKGSHIVYTAKYTHRKEWKGMNLGDALTHELLPCDAATEPAESIQERTKGYRKRTGSVMREIQNEVDKAVQKRQIGQERARARLVEKRLYRAGENNHGN